MTSHKGSGRGFRDQFGAMITWALREDVGCVTSTSTVWEQIHERLHGQRGERRMAWWRGFRLAYRSAALWLLDLAVGPPTELVYFSNPELGQIREKYCLRLLMYQNDLPLLLGQAV